MNRSRDLALIAALAATSCIAVAQQPALDADTARLCATVKDVEVPPQDRPTADEAAALQGCNAENLYFGFGVAQDSVKARKCAYIERETNTGGDLGGSALLAMIYANGKGAERNFELATKFACETNATPRDTAGRVHKLARYKQSHWTGDNFNVCEYSSEHKLYEICAQQQEKFDKIERDQKLNALMANWSAADKRAFEPLRAAANKFFVAHAQKEADLEATIEVHEEAFLRDRFVEALTAFENHELPAFSPDDLKTSEKEMNAIFQQTQTGKVSRWGSATRGGIASAQQDWIAYRDAFMHFGKVRYPSVNEMSWKTWLTRKRLEQLDKFAAELRQ